jgi:ADP-heptose:LPS heptosyltransferase
VQIGLAHEEQLVPDFRKNLSLDQLKELVNQCTTWIGVDSFFQHFCWDIGKKGIVLWGPSNPKIFGHPENINLLRGDGYLIPNQFVTWEQVEYQEERFVKPEEVMHHLKGLLN